MTDEDYQRLIREHAAKLGFEPYELPRHSSQKEVVTTELWFRHPPSHCIVVLPSTPKSDRYLSKAKAKLQANLNRATSVPPRVRRVPVEDKAPDIFWARTLLRMARERRKLFFPVDRGEVTARDETFRSEIAQLGKEPICVGCGDEIIPPSATPYCTDRCQQTAALVRYARKAAWNGRGEQDEDFLLGVGLLLVALFKGGYPTRERRLTRKQRQAVFVRNDGLCVLCGAPAQQVDHIRGSSSDPTNLRAVCAPCNRALALSAKRRPTAKQMADFLEEAERICTDLADRIAAPIASRCCDDHERWQSVTDSLRAARRRNLLMPRTLTVKRRMPVSDDHKGRRSVAGSLRAVSRRNLIRPGALTMKRRMSISELDEDFDLDDNLEDVEAYLHAPMQNDD